MIVDDHEGMRRMIRNLIAAPSDAVLECSSGDEAVQAAGGFKPDCVTMDINMPGLSAFKAAQAVRAAYPPAREVFVTGHDLPEYRRAAKDAGAAGFVIKEDLSELYVLVAATRLANSLKV
jgi:two-component system response regulator DesR